MAALALFSRFSLLRILKTTEPKCIIPLGMISERNYAKRIKGKNTPRKKPPKEELSGKHKSWMAEKLDKAVFKSSREDIEQAYEPAPVDNVWLIKKHRPPLFSVGDAVALHRETHHPTMFDEPDGKLFATLELDMKLAGSKTKTLEPFRGVLCYPNFFSPGKEKRVLAVCKEEQLQQEALKAGAVLSGGVDIVKMFKDNELKHEDFDHVVVHPEMLMEIVNIRGLLKHHFPTKQRGNLGTNVGELVHKFFKGVDYRTEKDVVEQQYATTDVLFGTLAMQENAIEENLTALLVEINGYRPPDVKNPFIISVNVWSPPSPEKLFVDFWKYLPTYDHDDMLDKYTTVNFTNK